MRRHLSLVGSTLAVLVGLMTGCSSASQSSDTTTTSATPTVPTTTRAPTTTLPATATGSAATTADAAAVLVAAWQHDDRAQAATIADAKAIEGMWATPREMITLRSCSTDSDALSEGGCIYRTDSGLVQVNTEKRAEGWVVSSVVYDALDNGNATSGDAPDAPPPTTMPPPTTAVDPAPPVS
ncbi:MAG TPA: hypothetical protein VFN21_12295 [Acidimicrobiales bacterium]|nr:hypothetical protein [Acidimicrobiales bacterium]